MSRHIFIFAGSHKEAAYLAKEKKLHPSNWTFLYKPEQLRGLTGGHFIRYGAYANSHRCIDIECMLIERKMIECTDVKVKK